MAELATIARPYAEALIKSIRPDDAVAVSEQVTQLSQVAANPQLRDYRRLLLVDLGRSARRWREAQVAPCQRLLAPAELRQQFRLPPLGARVGRFRIERGAQ